MSAARVAPWSVRQIRGELRAGLASCRTDFERSMWRVFAAKDVVRLLDGRRPRPGELAVLSEVGISEFAVRPDGV